MAIGEQYSTIPKYWQTTLCQCKVLGTDRGVHLNHLGGRLGSKTIYYIYIHTVLNIFISFDYIAWICALTEIQKSVL
jgi:hypothetical protein